MAEHRALAGDSAAEDDQGQQLGVERANDILVSVYR